MIRKLFKWFKKDVVRANILPRDKHCISREQINGNALKVLYRLHNAGFSAYLVGGCIRDLLLGITPKDFDIATNASPEEIKNLFYNCRLIGRRFRLAHIHFGRDIIEVATFRGTHVREQLQNAHGMILRDNVYGKIEEDVLRRDFTINALYYNIADFSVMDFVGGLEDLKRGQLNLIGNPEVRYREDPVRMLRAIRFAAKLNFKIHPRSGDPIRTMGNLLANIPAARLFEEYSKLFLTGNAKATYMLLHDYDVLKYLFPHTAKLPKDSQLILEALENTDKRVAEDKSVAPGFLLAVFNWHTHQDLCKHMHSREAIDSILREQQKIIAIPRRFVSMVRDIWEVQIRLEKRRSAKQVETLYALAKFRAAYDFLLLRANSDEKAKKAALWWQQYVEGDDDTKAALAAKLKPLRRKKKPNVQKEDVTDTK